MGTPLKLGGIPIGLVELTEIEITEGNRKLLLEEGILTE